MWWQEPRRAAGRLWIDWRNDLPPPRLVVLYLKEDDMMIVPTKQMASRAFRPALALVLIAAVLSPADLLAQGLPVQNGPMVPVALWWIGAFLLGAILIYGIMRNRTRTRAEKDLTERATKDLYAREARDEKCG
jgi:hypothetical protein